MKQLGAEFFGTFWLVWGVWLRQYWRQRISGVRHWLRGVFLALV